MKPKDLAPIIAAFIASPVSQGRIKSKKKPTNVDRKRKKARKSARLARRRNR